MTAPTRAAQTPPDAPAEAVSRAALLAGAGSGAITLLAVRLQPWLGLGTGFPIRVGAIAAGMMLVALTGFRDHHPFARVGAANIVTGVRALILALLAAIAFEPVALGPLRWSIVAAAAVGASLDLADGWLARRSKLTSAFGARFDMEVDALLILVLSVLVWRNGLSGPWVLASGLMRYAFVAAALVLPWMNRPLLPSRRRQAICVVQIVALIAALAPVTPAPAAFALAAGSLALLTWSFAVDVAWLISQRRA